MNKVAIVLCSILCLASSQAQDLRWRYREFNVPSVTGTVELYGVTNSGKMSVNITPPSGSTALHRVGILDEARTLHLAPINNNIPFLPRSGRITESGFIYGILGNQFAKWDPVNGYSTLPGAFPAISKMLMNSSGYGCFAVDEFPVFQHSLRTIDPFGNIGWMAGFGGENGYWQLSEINEAGYIAGQLGGKAVVWNPGASSYRILHTAPFEGSIATGINENGEILGFLHRYNPTPGTYAVVWDVNGNILRERFIEPQTPGSVTDYRRQGPYNAQINDLGEFTYTTGGGRTADQRSKFYSPLTGEVDITSSVEGLPHGAFLTEISGMNNSRVMTGTLFFSGPNGLAYRRNFYLEPVPEPATFAALGVGVVALLSKKKRRGKTTN